MINEQVLAVARSLGYRTVKESSGDAIQDAIDTGDWHLVPAKKLDNYLEDGERADKLIGILVKANKPIPDALKEALRRRYSDNEIAGSVGANIKDRSGSIREIVFRWDPSYAEYVFQHNLGMNSDAGKKDYIALARKIESYEHQQFDDPVTHTAANAFLTSDAMKEYLSEKRKQNKEEKKREEEEKAKKAEKLHLSMHPTQSEHWMRLMPDEMPSGPVNWDVLRSSLKTKDKQAIEMVLRELEKIGAITKNEHGNKVFDPEALKRFHAQEKISFTHAAHSWFRPGGQYGKYNRMQFVRQDSRHVSPAIVGVGLSNEDEALMKKKHKKLAAWFKKVRSSNHKVVNVAPNSLGWVRIDKLSSTDWMIEELQQDISNIFDDRVGKNHYGAETHQSRFDNRQKQYLTATLQADGSKQFAEILEEYRQKLEACYKKHGLSLDETGTRILIAPEVRENTPFDKHLKTADVFITSHLMKTLIEPEMRAAQDDVYKKHQQIVQGTADKHDVHIYVPLENNLYDPNNENWWDLRIINKSISGIYDMVAKDSKDLENIRSDVEMYRGNLGKPESKETDEWEKDKAFIRNLLNHFPRMAMTAVRKTARENGVERLWWVNYATKKMVGNANPPKSSTADQLAKKFGFKPYTMEQILGNDKAFQASSPPMRLPLETVNSLNDIRRTMRKRSDEIRANNDKWADAGSERDRESYEDKDMVLYMVPVDQLVVEHGGELVDGMRAIFG